VGHGPVRPASDDGLESHGLCAVGAHVYLDLPGDLPLCHARAHNRDGVSKGVISQSDSPSHPLYLVLILRRADAFHDLLGGYPLHVGSSLDPFMVHRHRYKRSLESHPLGPQLGQQIGQMLVELVAYLGQSEVWGLGLDLLIVAEISREYSVIGRDEQSAGRAGEATEIASVLGLVDEDDVQFLLGQLMSQKGQSVVHCFSPFSSLHLS